MNRWSKLNKFQLNEEGRKFAEAEFGKSGFDVYISSNNHRAIDFIVKRDEELYGVQVSSVRLSNRKSIYAFSNKNVFKPRKNLLCVLLMFGDKESPEVYLISSLDWMKKKYGSFLVNREFKNKKSKPEWGIYLYSELDKNIFKNEFIFNRQIAKL